MVIFSVLNTTFPFTVAKTSKLSSRQISLVAKSCKPGQTQWNLIFTAWCSGQIAPIGQTTPTSISVAGTTTPSTLFVPLTNLGNTITLPGSWESLNLGSRPTGGSCANVGAAKARTGIK